MTHVSLRLLENVGNLHTIEIPSHMTDVSKCLDLRYSHGIANDHLI